MAGENSYQQSIDQAKAGIASLSEELKKLDTKIAETGRMALEMSKNFGAKTPQDMNKQLEAQLAAIQKLDAAAEASQKKREAQVKAESDLRERLRRQRDKEEADNFRNAQKATQAVDKLNASKAKELALAEKTAKAAERASEANQKLANAYNQLAAKQQAARSTLQHLMVLKGKNNKETRTAQKEYDRLTKKINQANAATNNFAKGGLGGAIRGVQNLAAAFGLVGGTMLFADLIRDVFSLTKTLDAQRFTMETITENIYEMAEAKQFLSRITNMYGADLIKTTERYLKFYTAAKQSNVSLAATENIFETVTKAAGVLGLKIHETEGVYLALEQMFSKGKVTTEELRRQLGERLPGAFGIMADALDVSTQKLDDMLRKGEVLSAEALPKFAEALKKAYSLDAIERVDTLVASQNRLKNAWVEYVDGVSGDAGKLVSIFNFLSRNLSKIIDTAIALVKSFLAYKAVVIGLSLAVRAYTGLTVALSIAKVALSQGLKAATVQMGLFNAAARANPLGILISAVGVATAAYVAFKDSVSDSVKAMKELKEQSDKTTLAIIDNSIKEVQARIDSVEGDENASKNRLKIIDDEIKERENGTFDMYDEIETIQTESNNKQEKELKRSLQEKQKILTQYNIEYQKALKEGLTLPTRPDVTITPEELGVSVGATVEEQAQSEVIRRLKLMRSQFIDDLKKDNEEIKEVNREKDKSILDSLGALKGSMVVYQEQIKVLERHRESLSETSAEYQHFGEMIDRIKDQMARLDGSFDWSLDMERPDADAIDKFLDSEGVESGMINLSNILGQEMDSLQAEFYLNYKGDYESFLEFLKMKMAAFEQNAKGLTDIQVEQISNWVGEAAAMFDAVMDIANGFSERRIQNIERETDALNEMYDTQLANENLTAERRKEIEDEREKRLAVLEERKKKEQEKQAKMAKAQAAMNVVVQTSLAIISALAQVPKFDFGVSATAVAATFAAVGAAQLAAVLAQPIPKYKTGRKGGKEEMAILGDGGKHEPIIDAQGNLRGISPNTPTLMKLNKGDSVLPSTAHLSKDYQSILNASVMTTLAGATVNNDSDKLARIFDAKLSTLQNKIENGIEKGFGKVPKQGNRDLDSLANRLRFIDKRDAL